MGQPIGADEADRQDAQPEDAADDEEAQDTHAIRFLQILNTLITGSKPRPLTNPSMGGRPDRAIF
jgi:hypothetical protein